MAVRGIVTTNKIHNCGEARNSPESPLPVAEVEEEFGMKNRLVPKMPVTKLVGRNIIVIIEMVLMPLLSARACSVC